MMYVSGMSAPVRSRATQKRTWWPSSCGWPAGGGFLAGSLHSLPSMRQPNEVVGLNTANVGCVPLDPSSGGRNVWAHTPSSVKSLVTVVEPLGCQYSDAVFPCVWNDAICRAVTGEEVSA